MNNEEFEKIKKAAEHGDAKAQKLLKSYYDMRSYLATLILLIVSVCIIFLNQ